MRGNRTLKVEYRPVSRFWSSNCHFLQMVLNSVSGPEHILPVRLTILSSLGLPDVLKDSSKDRVRAISEVIDDYPVMQFNAFPAPYNPKKGTAFIADLITGCVSQGLKGLILESHRAGNFPGNRMRPEEGAIYHALKPMKAVLSLLTILG